MTELLTADEARGLVQDQAHEKALHGVDGYEHLKPLARTADSLINVLAYEGEDVTFGLPKIDLLTRGFRAKELIFVTGFANSGKTQLLNNLFLRNKAKRTIFFSMDDPAEMILAKLVSMHEDVPADKLEEYVRQDEHGWRERLREHARTTFRNLYVIDQPLGVKGMEAAVDEATHAWGAPPEIVAVDYLSTVRGKEYGESYGDGVAAKAQNMKAWTKDLPCPLFVIHQGTKSECPPGKPVTLKSMGYAGHAEGTFVVGVRRKADDPELEASERRPHLNTITLHRVKNKRPPAQKTGPAGEDYFIDPNTGLIRDLRSGDRSSGAEQIPGIRGDAS